MSCVNRLATGMKREGQNGSSNMAGVLCYAPKSRTINSGRLVSQSVAWMALFATGVALSVLLIAAYSRPFTGEISVTPELLKQVIATEAKGDTSR